MVPFELEFCEEAQLLQRLCFPPPFPKEDLFSRDDFLFNLRQFPEGQFMVLQNQELAATSTNMIITDSAWSNLSTWENLVGGLHIVNHNVSGSTLFGVDISVHPKYRKMGLAKKIYEARLGLARKLNLVRFATACRLPGLSRYPDLSPHDFGRKVASGEIVDLPLSAFLKIGLNLQMVVENFMNDPESRHCCAILEIPL